MTAFERRWIPEVALTREFNAERINAVLNHPEVRPMVADAAAGVVDVSRIVANPRNHLLMGEHGGCLLVYLQSGVFEVHTQVLPEGRGPWAVKLIQAVSHYGYTRTDAIECLTRVPSDNAPAKALTMRSGLRYDFTRLDGARRGADVIPVDVYSYRLQDWVRAAPGLEEFGRAFHAWMHGMAAEFGITTPLHDDDPNHNRYVGAALEMAMHGQIRKAALFYNRWAAISRHPVVQLLSNDPPVLKFDIACLRLVDGNLRMFRDPGEAMSWAAY